MSAVGKVLRDRYEIITELGKGGMSTVYLAKDKNLESYWAVKQVKNNGDVDIEAFKKEVELLATLSHPDVPRIVDRIDIEEDFFVVMDFIDGASLAKKINQEGPADEKDVVEWAKLLCDILEYLHTAKEDPIIYRDMKPDNVMLTQAGRIKLIDFGIAKECKKGKRQAGANIGTPGYAAPEQYKGASNILDERTDIYSLGATLFFLLTGEAPKKPPNAVKPIRQINPALSEGIEYIIMKCAKDNPEDRYQNIGELKEDLKNIELLTSSYRKKMVKKLRGFIFCIGGMFLSLIIMCSGLSGVQKENEDNYLHFYKIGMEASRNEDYRTASENFYQAIEYKPKQEEIYILYFYSLLPQDEAPEYLIKTKDAIDVMRNSFLENEKSEMYKNETLMFQVAKKCLEVNDASYAAYASEYFELLREEGFDAQGMDSYCIIASNCSQNLETQNFEKFGEELINLEKTTDETQMSANDKLSNYYTIVAMYNAYPSYFEDSYEAIYRVGQKAKKIIDSNLESEEFTFNSIIPLYEMIASGLCSNAILLEDNQKKENQYLSSLEWFGYLEDLNADLNEKIWLKKAGAYYSLFEISCKTQSNTGYDPQGVAYLSQAISEYKKILEKYDDSFLIYVNIAEACMNLELTGNASGYSDFNIYYAKVIQMKESNRNLSSIELSRYSVFKKNVENAGFGR